MFRIFREILGEVKKLSTEVKEMKKQNLNNTADLARLIFEAQQDKITMQSVEFLLRMDIKPPTTRDNSG